MKTDHIDDSSAPLVEHLAELRTRIVYSLLAFVVAFLIAFMIADHIFNFLSHPVCVALLKRGQECQLVLIKLQEGFMVTIRIAMLGGFALAFPIIAYQLWRFVAPGLYRSEKQAFLPFLIASPVMFFVGAGFAYYIILPFAFDFFLGFQQTLTPTPVEGAVPADVPAGVLFQGSMEGYLALTMSFVIAFGLCFQLPVLLTLMGRAGIISSQGLVTTRKYAIVIILTIAAIVTPPDIVSQLILFAAIYPLFELSIILIRRFEKQREDALKAEGLWEPEDDEAAGEGVPAKK